MFKKLFTTKAIKQNKQSPANSYVHFLHNAIWMQRNYREFASEAYIKNVIAHRAISLIAQGAASVDFSLFAKTANGKQTPIHNHKLLNLLARPNPRQSKKEFFLALYTYRQIHGNAYILMNDVLQPNELYSLRPDRVIVNAGEGFFPINYIYKVNQQEYAYSVDQVTGQSQIIHLKNFHPLSDWQGLSSIEAAAYSIDQHNQAGAWNQALLQNGARPSGALIVKNADGKPAHLDANEFARLRQMIDESFGGAFNAGRPLLLEGGLEWQEMSLSPRDMDFIDAKNSAARDIALAFGVPPQLLGIPGDNTYSNLIEARIALWEQTILPLVNDTLDYLNQWIVRLFGAELILYCNTENIGALAQKREAVWQRVQAADFMTINEKRQAVGLAPIGDGDYLMTK
jgi:HK97 family phage portal protein